MQHAPNFRETKKTGDKKLSVEITPNNEVAKDIMKLEETIKTNAISSVAPRGEVKWESKMKEDL